MNVARLNFSHGSHESHRKTIETIRDLNRLEGFKLKILQDLEGFRIRIGEFGDPDGLVLEKDDTVIFSAKPVNSDIKYIPFDYNEPLDRIGPGKYIYIDDGYIALKIVEAYRDYLVTKVVNPGVVKPHKGVNIPGMEYMSSTLTDKDRKDLEFGLEMKVDMIAQSFVRNAEDVAPISDAIRESGREIPLIAKIESHEGVENLDQILESVDGIMVARGDLGVSYPIYQVPVMQKEIIHKCRVKNKIIVTATQMLETMTGNRRPTRAEVSDVANAILDGSDYVMLSGETAVGKYPVETVRMMQHIIDYTEEAVASKRIRPCIE